MYVLHRGMLVIYVGSTLSQMYGLVHILHVYCTGVPAGCL